MINTSEQFAEGFTPQERAVVAAWTAKLIEEEFARDGHDLRFQ
jgi:hypothetical protein